MATMQFNKALALLLAVLLLSAAGSTSGLGIADLGINCRGSTLCGSQSSHTLSEINTAVQQLNDGNVYSNGEHIVCVGHICAFLQNISGTKTAAQIKVCVRNLLQHGCSVCGSDPTEPGNNVNDGELTVNYVSSPICTMSGCISR